jgi:hypothetical protein
MSKPCKHDPQWAKAKQVCRLNMEDIRMAKELGMSPKTLMKNQPSPSQRWKLPVKLWIRELHAKRFRSRATTAGRPAQPAPPPHSTEADDADADIPF